MKSTNDVRTFYRNAVMGTRQAGDNKVLAEALRAGGFKTQQQSVYIKPSIGRAIMTSRITHLTAAAVIVAAVIVSLTCFNGPTVKAVELSEISKAITSVPWMHASALAQGSGITGTMELWIGFDAWVQAGKAPDGKMSFCQFKERQKVQYDPNNNTVTLSDAQEDEFFPERSSPVQMLESMRALFKEHDAKIVAKMGQYQGQKVLIQDISLTGMGKGIDRYEVRLYIDPESKLLYGAKATAYDADGKVVSSAKIDYDYPKTGPKDIYELGVPRTARIVDNLIVTTPEASAEQDQQSPQDANVPSSSELIDEQQRGSDLATESVTSLNEEKTMLVRVLDKGTGDPIAKADIRTYINGGNSYTADANGQYVLHFGSDTPQHMNLFARKPGYVGQCIRFDCTMGFELPSEFTFELDKGATIGGIVQDAEGQPVQGAKVIFTITDEKSANEVGIDTRYAGTTDSQGRWECSTVPVNVIEIFIRTEHPDFAEGRFSVPREISLEALQAKTAVMQIDGGITCYGYVLDQQRHLMAGARLLFGESHYTDDPRDRSVTDANGCFEFVHRRPLNRDFLITVQATGFAPAMREVFVNEVDEPIEFVLEPGHRIVGHVVDTEGDPVQDAKVSVQYWQGHQNIQWQSQTDVDGRFAWEDAPADEVKMYVYKSGYMSVNSILSPWQEEHEFVLVRPIHVSGKVVDAATGTPVNRFKVIPKAHGFWLYDSGWVSTHEDGRYEYESSSYQLRIEAEGYLPAESRTISHDEQDVVIDFELVKAEGQRGIVVTIDGAPVSGAEIFLEVEPLPHIRNNFVENRRWLQQQGTFVRTDADGRFQFKSQNQEYPIAVMAKEGFAYVTPEAFAQNNTIVLEPFGRIEGDFLRGTQPAAGQNIYVACEGHADLSISYDGTTDENGRFVLEKVVSGQVRIDQQRFDLQPGQTIEIHLGGGGRTVTGRLIDPSGATSVENMGLVSLSIDSILSQIPDREFPRPEGLADMNYTEVEKWLQNYVQSDEGLRWRQEIEQKYQLESKRYRARIEGDGVFYADNVQPGHYVIHGSIYQGAGVYGSMGPSPSPPSIVARVAHEFVVPEFEYPEQMDEPLDLGDIVLLTGELEVGDMAPEFEVSKLAETGTIRLSDYAGKFLLLNFYNSYILTKASERLEGIQQVKSQFGSRNDLVIVGIYLDPTSVGYMAEKLLQERKLSGPHGVAGQYSSKIVTDYSTKNLPYSVLIGPTGEVLSIGLKGQDLVQSLQEILRP